MSNLDYFCLWNFGPGGIGQWILTSGKFQFLICGVLTYPFAWIISAEKDELKRKRLYWLYILCSLILPTIYLCTAQWVRRKFLYSSHLLTSFNLPQLLRLMLWVLKLWMILILQVFIRKFCSKRGFLGTVIASAICAWLLYTILEFLVPTFLAGYKFS